MRILILLSCIFSFQYSFGQARDSAAASKKLVLVPYQSMMYFSDADPDIARVSRMEEPRLRNEIRSQVELNAYHQLLAGFDVTSLMRATALQGEKDLNRIYAATRYTTYSRRQKEEYFKDKGREEASTVKNLLSKFSRKSKDQSFWVSDSAVMLAVITDREIFQYLHKKYDASYILFITQFEIATNNKNTIEWTRQEYKREYTLHYNLFDRAGNLVRAEMLTIQAGGENDLKEIGAKYLVLLAQRLKDLLATEK